MAGRCNNNVRCTVCLSLAHYGLHNVIMRARPAALGIGENWRYSNNMVF